MRSFLGHELDWELELRIRAKSAPAAMIGGPQQLGWSGWLGQSLDDQPITGMRFEPERYLTEAA